MLYSFFMYVIIFFVYSLIGYIFEIINISIVQKKLIYSRGFFIGPYLPIYGFGACILVFYLGRYQYDFFSLFILSLVLCCLLEYITSLIMEKIFKLRWWDYSNRRFNLDGRVCLENGILFGLGGVFVVRYLHPLIFNFVSLLSINLVYILGFTITIVFVSDFLFSTYTILKLKIDTKTYINKDATTMVRNEVIKSLNKYRLFHKRLFKAFPNITKSKNIILIHNILDKYYNNTKK